MRCWPSLWFSYFAGSYESVISVTVMLYSTDLFSTFPRRYCRLSAASQSRNVLRCWLVCPILLSWVMLSDTEGFIRLPGERILYTSPPRTTLSLQTQNTYPGAQPLSINSSAGCVHLTNQRVRSHVESWRPDVADIRASKIVYLPASPTASLLSFSAPILNLHDTHVSAPFFGPNVWRAALKAVPGGGIPPTRSLIEMKMVFRDGGAFDFHSNFERIKERLQQAIEVARESGHVVGDGSETGGGHGGGALSGLNMAALDLEQLPAYEEAQETPPMQIPAEPLPSSAPLTDRRQRDSGIAVSSDEDSSRKPVAVEPIVEAVIPPVEPPPGYEEVQRDSVANELERRLQPDG